MIDLTEWLAHAIANEDLDVVLGALALRESSESSRQTRLFLADSPRHWLLVSRDEAGRVTRVIASSGQAREMLVDAVEVARSGTHDEVNEARKSRIARST